MKKGWATTFQLTLPVLPVQHDAVGPELPAARTELTGPADRLRVVPTQQNEQASNDLQQPSILIVEDNEELREFLAGELAGSYQIFQAADGDAGWSITQAELPDVVLTDVMMPRLDGYELTRLIRNSPDTNHIAVVMLTAKAALRSRLDGLEDGADDYLSKPFSIAELQLRLHNLITRRQTLGDYYRQQFALPVADNAPASVVNADPFLDRIYRLLDEHLDNPDVSVDWLADQLDINRKMLYRKVQSLIQLPPADLIRQYRLRKAADLLRAGHSVSETAYRVGFNTPSRFTISFKEFYGKTPSDFVKNG